MTVRDDTKPDAETFLGRAIERIANGPDRPLATMRTLREGLSAGVDLQPLLDRITTLEARSEAQRREIVSMERALRRAGIYPTE